MGSSAKEGKECNVVRMRGVPHYTKAEEISKFFEGHKFKNGSLIFGATGLSRQNGFAYVQFDSYAKAKAARDALKGNLIGSRYIDLYPMYQDSYLELFQKLKNQVSLSKFINEENKSRCLIARGLPFDTTPEKISEFFSGHGEVSTNFEIVKGRGSGCAAIFFEDENVAKKAHKAL